MRIALDTLRIVQNLGNRSPIILKRLQILAYDNFIFLPNTK